MNPLQQGLDYPVRFGTGHKKVFLLTHTDLDGISCELAFRMSPLASECAFTCWRIDYGDLNVVKGIENEMCEYGYVTDLRLKDETLIALGRHWNTIVFDHHQWDTSPRYGITLNIDSTRCAALISWEILGTPSSPGVDGIRTAYFNYVDAYDMWRRDHKRDFMMGKVLNHLLHTIGKDKFVERMLARLSDPPQDSLLTQAEVKDYEKYQSGIQNRAEFIIEQMVEFKDNDGNACGYATTDSTNSDVMNTILELAPQLEYVAIYNRTKKAVSLRRKEGSTVDLSKVAARYGGGGHPAAAGYVMPEHLVKGYRL